MESLKLTGSTNNTKNSVMTFSSTCPAAEQTGARQQFNQQVTENYINKIRAYLIHTNGFDMQPSAPKRNSCSRRSQSLSLTRLKTSSGPSASSTHSSSVPYTSSSSSSSSSTHSSPVLPSSTHSSPILPSSRTPSPVHPIAPPPIHNGADISKLSSQRDPVTNKIVIKTMTNNNLKESARPTRSKSVIAEAETSSSLLRTTAVESAKGQPGSKGLSSSMPSSSSSPPLPPSPSPLSSVPFSLPPLSVRSIENHNQENLPDLLKPQNLAKYVYASAPKKTPTEKTRYKPSNSVLLDHDYSLAVREEPPSEKNSKRTFIIPKKRSCTNERRSNGWKLQDNLEVVDMECSDGEDDSPIVVERKNSDMFNSETPKKKVVETPPSNVALMLYGRDEYRSQCTLIDEEAEIRFAKGHYVYTDRDESNYYNYYFNKMKDPFGCEKAESSYCLLNPMPASQSDATPDSWWQEIEDVVKSVHPNCENSVFSHLTEIGVEDNNKLLKISNDGDTADSNTFIEESKIQGANLQESVFYPISDFVSVLKPENVAVDEFDVKEEIVEESSFVVSEESAFSADELFSLPPAQQETVVRSQYVSLLSAGRPPQPTPCTSDPMLIFLDESKENMVDKVPAYLSTSSRFGMKKNVLQRLNLEPDELAKNNRCSPLYENRSPSPHQNRSPSPDYSRSRSSRNAHREGYHKKYDHHRRRCQRLSRSRSRSPAYSRRQTSKTCQPRTDDYNDDEQRRVVYVGKLPNDFTDKQLKDLFKKYGEIEKVSLYFRSGKDNYGFVSFKDKVDATCCLEDTHRIPNFPYEVCYGGRREFCKEDYADLDGITEQQEEFGRVSIRREDTSFEQLLKQYSRDRRR